MIWKLNPSHLHGSIAIPPSKSHTIRALLVGTLAEGASVIRRPLMHGDGRSAMGVAVALGAQVKQFDDRVEIVGVGDRRDGGSDSVFTGNSGTSTNLFASAAALGSRPRTFDGDASIRSRPVKPLLDALAGLGARVRVLPEATRDVPFEIRGPMTGGQVTVNGLSSQFVSSLLLSCPLASGTSIINVVNLHERPYIELTLWWLRHSGIRFETTADLSRFVIPGGQVYAPIDMAVPGDFSSATFAAVAAAITGSSVRLTGLDFTDPQGDKGVFDVLGLMGASVNLTSDGAVMSCNEGLDGRTIDLNTMPDALPAMAVAACAARGETRLVNVAHARIKETDRIAVMTRELRAMGADIQEQPDGLVIRHSKLHGAHVHGHDDHRVVMALALAGMIAEGETAIDTAEAAEVTYPTFAEDFCALGANVEVVAE